MKISAISVSRKGIWEECQQKYKYKYELKTVTDTPEPIYLSYGSLVHRVAELYVEHKGKKLISELAQDVLQGRIPFDEGKKPPVLTPEYQRKLPVHLKNIQKLTDQTGFDGHLEYNFRYDLDPPNGCFVTGFIDRLIQRGDKFFILDYKTTKQGWWRKSAKDIVTDLQLRVYARVVQKTFNAKAENIHAALYYVEDGELIGARFTDDALKKAEQELLASFIDIINTDPEDAYGNVGEWCRRCDYRKVCPYYSLT